VPRGHEKAFLALCTENNLAHAPIGVVDGRSGALEVRGQFRIPLDELRQAYSSTLPALFGHVVGAAGQEDTPAGGSDAAGAITEAGALAQAAQAELASEALVAADTEVAGAGSEPAADDTADADQGASPEPGASVEADDEEGTPGPGRTS
jgi:phosphoribosylformylglycinamidine synthase